VEEVPEGVKLNPEAGGKVGSMEIRTMMIVSVLGIALIFVIYMRLTSRSRRRLKVSTL
jgi:hypothetical protein